MTPYILNIEKTMVREINKSISIVILIAFFATSVKSPAFAQSAQGDIMLRLPVPGVMVHLSPEFTPAHLQGITIHPDNALQFDFLIHKGDQVLDGGQKRVEYKKLVKYFLASLTIPDEDQWVNLSPYEHDRIIKDDFGKTEMGRDLLAEDYMLKQITSSLIYPEDGLGKKFWDKIYERAWKEYHTTNVPVNTFNKVWIVPDQAIVYESGNTAYILKSHLKVMLEEDYLSLSRHSERNEESKGVLRSFVNAQDDKTHSIGSQVIREVILPELEKEVNEGKNFANLRQMYGGMILATWYKKALKESLLGKIYADKAKVAGIIIPAQAGIQKMDVNGIYQRYLKAFKKGVFNYIKEDVDKYTQEAIPRKYFSGGFNRIDPAMNGIIGDEEVKVISSKNSSGIDAALLVSAIRDSGDLDRATISINPQEGGNNSSKFESSKIMSNPAMISSLWKKELVNLENVLREGKDGFENEKFRKDLEFARKLYRKAELQTNVDVMREISRIYWERQFEVVWGLVKKRDFMPVETIYEQAILRQVGATEETTREISKIYWIGQSFVAQSLVKMAVLAENNEDINLFGSVEKIYNRAARRQVGATPEDSQRISKIYWDGQFGRMRSLLVAQKMADSMGGVFHKAHTYQVGATSLIFEELKSLITSIPKTPIEIRDSINLTDEELNFEKLGFDTKHNPKPLRGELIEAFLHKLSLTKDKKQKDILINAFKAIRKKTFIHPAGIVQQKNAAMITQIFKGPWADMDGPKQIEDIRRRIAVLESRGLDYDKAFEAVTWGIAQNSFERANELQPGDVIINGDSFYFVKSRQHKIEIDHKGAGKNDAEHDLITVVHIDDEGKEADSINHKVRLLRPSMMSHNVMLPRLEIMSSGVSSLLSRSRVLRLSDIAVKTVSEEDQSRNLETRSVVLSETELKELRERVISAQSENVTKDTKWGTTWKVSLGSNDEKTRVTIKDDQEGSKIFDFFRDVDGNYLIYYPDGRHASLRRDASIAGPGETFFKVSINGDNTLLINNINPNKPFTVEGSSVSGHDAAMKGGIDFNSVNLNLQIKRDGRGVPLPWPKQDMAQMSRIQGFEPEIIEIKPAINVPIITELQQKLQTSG
jgi:hypothetical protein